MAQDAMWGWYPEGNKWVKLRVDIDGSFHVVGYIDKLEDIGDVILTAIANNDILYWYAPDSEWRNIAHLGVADAHHAKTGDNEVKGLILSDVIANIPAFGVVDRFFWATDEHILYRDTGAAWVKAAVADHPDLDGIGADDHHARYTDGEADARIALHALVAAAHHAAFIAADHTAIGDAAPHHAEAHDLASHTTKAHAELTNVTENQHHTKFTTTEHTAIGDGAPHHAKYTDAAAKAAAVQAGAITNGVTKAPTHDAVYDVKVTADTATTPAEVATLITAHKDDPDAHHTILASITFIIDGGGAVITTGEKGHLEIPFACTINAWTLLADQDGAIKIDVWRDTYAAFPPDNTDSLCNGHEPEIVATAKKAQDLDLGDWTSVALVAGDILAFNVDTVAAIQRVTLSLKVTKA